jgi:UDP-3-O-acyl-N-acetylglucosamine deacetylase
MNLATIQSQAYVSGIALHTGRKTSVRLLPRHEYGIVFVRTDLNRSPAIPATTNYLDSALRRTDLRNRTARIGTVEHLLAACFGFGIGALTVEVDGPELPIGDGSARVWTDAMVEAGIVKDACDPPPLIRPDPVEIVRGGRWIKLRPSGAWSVTFGGRFPDGLHHEARWTPEKDFVNELAGARTFSPLAQVVAMRRAGLILGGSPTNSLVFADGSVTSEQRAELSRHWPDVDLSSGREGLIANQKLRWNNEPARHKLLDVLGDLMLAGPLSPCRVEVEQGGHDLTRRLLRRMRENGIET